MLEKVLDFIHSPNFWSWHGFVLSTLWLFGSAIGIALKKKNVNYHLLAFVVINYVSLFFMLSALYLLLAKLHMFMNWSNVQKIHVIGGLGFLVALSIQHVQGALAWHRGETNMTHRRLGVKLAIYARILAGVGWSIHEENRIYSVTVFTIALLLYIFAERASWSKIKTE